MYIQGCTRGVQGVLVYTGVYRVYRGIQGIYRVHPEYTGVYPGYIQGVHRGIQGCTEEQNSRKEQKKQKSRKGEDPFLLFGIKAGKGKDPFPPAL